MFLSSCVEPLVTHGHSLPHWQWIQSVMHSILSNCHHVKTPMWKIKYKFVNYYNSSPFFLSRCYDFDLWNYSLCGRTDCV